MSQDPMPDYLEHISEDADENLRQDGTLTPKVLIADDVEVNRLILKKYVLKLGYTPILVENGRDALMQIEQERPDLLLLDILMPEMDGYEVLSRLKEDEATCDLPVLVISAVDSLDSVVRCIERGADDYLVKPFNPTILQARVNACLDKKAYRDRERRLHEELATSYMALRKVERDRDALMHMIVHDLKNPLAVVIGGTDMVLEQSVHEEIDQEKLTDTLEFVRDGAAEMSLLINGILDVSRLEAGKMPVTTMPINAVEAARQVYDSMVIQATHLNIHCDFRSDSDDLTVIADRELLARVLKNLISNAFKYIGRGGQVDLAVEEVGTEIVFTVTDDGMGIPEAHQATIFDKYIQVDGYGAGRYGVGLGLAFCKMAVTAQGGRIRVESKPDEGARFYVTLRAETTED